MPDQSFAPRMTYVGIYSAKVAIAGMVTLALCNAVGLSFGVWAVISAVMVMQPELRPSVEAALVRVKANIVGAGVGMLFGLTLGHGMLSLGGGLAVTGILCHAARWEDGLRSAFAAVGILILDPMFNDDIMGPLFRLAGVLAGCMVSLLITYLFDRVARWLGVPTSKTLGQTE